jgi:hypothetical protein
VQFNQVKAKHFQLVCIQKWCKPQSKLLLYCFYYLFKKIIHFTLIKNTAIIKKIKLYSKKNIYKLFQRGLT